MEAHLRPSRSNGNELFQVVQCGAGNQCCNPLLHWSTVRGVSIAAVSLATAVQSEAFRDVSLGNCVCLRCYQKEAYHHE